MNNQNKHLDLAQMIVYFTKNHITNIFFEINQKQNLDNEKSTKHPTIG